MTTLRHAPARSDQAPAWVLEQLVHLKIASQTPLPRPPPEAELRNARAYDLGADVGAVKRILFVKPGSRVAYLQARRANDGFGGFFEEWSRLDLTEAATGRDASRDALAYARETYQASNRLDNSLKPYFTKDLGSLPGQVRAALVIMQAAHPDYETGVIRDNWQGRFNWFTVVAYDPRNGGGTGESFGSEGESFGRFPLHPR